MDMKVAVCLAGAVRTLTTDTVTRSILTNLIGALREQGVRRHALFLHLKRDDVSGNTGRPDRLVPKASDKTLFDALQKLRPDVVEFGDRFQPKGECPLSTVQKLTRATSFDSAINQIFANHRCGDMVTRFEQGVGWRFTHVIRARPDLLWKRPVTLVGLPRRGIRYHDLCYVLPRSMVDPVLSAPYAMYRQCTDPFARTFDTGAALWGYRLMDRAQLLANLSFEEHMRFWQGGVPPAELDVPLRPPNLTQTADGIMAATFCPIQIVRATTNLSTPTTPTRTRQQNAGVE